MIKPSLETAGVQRYGGSIYLFTLDLTIDFKPSILYSNKRKDGESTLQTKATVNRRQCEPGASRLQRKITPERRAKSHMTIRPRRFLTVT